MPRNNSLVTADAEPEKEMELLAGFPSLRQGAQHLGDTLGLETAHEVLPRRGVAIEFEFTMG